jgi:hypothetical protein
VFNIGGNSQLSWDQLDHIQDLDRSKCVIKLYHSFDILGEKLGVLRSLRGLFRDLSLIWGFGEINDNCVF